MSQVPSLGRLLMAAPLDPEDLPARQDGLLRVYLAVTKIILPGTPTKPVAMPKLIAWMDRNSSALSLSITTIAEVKDGIAKSRRQGAHCKAERLARWLKTLLRLSATRVPPIDMPTARRIGALADQATGQGRAPGLADLAIAATA